MKKLTFIALFSLAILCCDWTMEAVNNEISDTLITADTLLKIQTRFTRDTVTVNELISTITTVKTVDSITTRTKITAITLEGKTTRDTSLSADTVNLDRDTTTKTDTTAWPLDTLKGAAGLAAGEGILLVTNRDTSLPGTFIVDAPKNRITGAVRSAKGLPPNMAAMVNDSVMVVTNTDYKDGSIGWANLFTGELDLDYEDIGPDNHIAVQGSKAYLLERATGIVTGFTLDGEDRGKMQKETVFLNMNTGASSNPHGIAVWEGKKAFITRYGSARLLIANPAKLDGGDTSSMDLSRYVAGFGTDSASDVPHMSGIHLYGKHVFVALQRLTGFTAVEKGLLLVINAETDSIVKEIELKYKNPYHISARGKHLFLSCVEGWGTKTGGILKFDMAALKSAGTVATEKELGGDVSAFVAVSDEKGYAIVGNWPVNIVESVNIP